MSNPRSLTFCVYGTPKGQGNHRRNRAGATYEATKGHGLWRRAVIAVSAAESRRAGLVFTGPVFVHIGLQFARPASHYRTGRNINQLKATAPECPITRSVGDIDKHARSILDSLTAARVIADDSLVVALDVSKQWCVSGELPGAVITVREVLC